MWVVSIVVAVLLLIGVFLISDTKVGNVKEKIIGARDYSVQKVKDVQSSKKISLKKQVEMVTGKQKSNFFVQSFTEARSILVQSGQSNKIKMINILSLALGVVGLLLAVLLGNIFLAPTLTIGFMLLPSWYVRIMENFFKKHLNGELEIALSTVTTSYIRNDNLILAMEENLKYLNSPVKQVFTTFVNENKVINSNVIYGLQKMKNSLDSSIFHEWCDAMIQCQSDRTLKVTLLPIVNKFSDMKSIQEELDTMIFMPLRDFSMVSMIVLLSIPMMRLLNEEWYAALVDTTPGKVILSIVSLCLFYGLNKAITLSKPIEYRR